MEKKQQPKLRLKSRVKKVFLAILAVLVLGLAGFGIYKFFNPLDLKAAVQDVQIGTEYKPDSNIKSLFMGNVKDVKFSGDVDTSKAGDYQASYEYKGKKYPFTVSVSDRKAPVVTAHNLEIDSYETLDPNRFIDEIQDDSTTTVTMDNSMDNLSVGTFPVTLTITDAYGNETKKEVKLTRTDDQRAPSIEDFNEMISLKQGSSFPEPEYTVKDNLDPNPSLTMDTAGLDMTVPGNYRVTYTVADRSGNKKDYVQTVTVNEDPDYGKKILYLTFDDGPSANTSKILDILNKYNATATFFVTGNYPDYYKEMNEVVQQGSTLALHTFSHNYNEIYKSEEAYFDDLNKIHDLVEQQTGTDAVCIRFPGGSSNTVSAFNPGIMTKLVKEVEDAGYTYFDWNADSTDASGNNVPVSQLIDNSTAYIGTEKVVLLMHDGPGKDTTVEALPEIIKAYQKAGYEVKALQPDSYAPHHDVQN